MLSPTLSISSAMKTPGSSASLAENKVIPENIEGGPTASQPQAEGNIRMGYSSD